jgi:hypothetical protein
MQTQGMQRVREMIRFELVASDAGFLSDCSGVGSLWVERDLGVCKTRRRFRQRAAIDGSG